MSTIFVEQVHTKNILQNLWVKCENENLCDVVLIAGPEKIRIPAHRLILSEASDYFNGMFTSSMQESKSKDVPMSSVDGDILKPLIKFCYTGRIEIKEANVVELLKTADMLLLESVVMACGNFLAKQLHPSTSLGFALLAERYNCQSLLTQAKDFSSEHFVDVYKTDDFLKLNAEQLCELLSSDKLCATNEKDVFQSVMLWIQHDPAERETHKFDLLNLVRMPLLERSFLIDHVAPLFMSTTNCQQFLKAMEWHLVPDRRTHNISRKSDELLMAITQSNQKMYIHFYCPQRLKWMKWKGAFEYRIDFELALIEDNLYMLGGDDRINTRIKSIYCLNLKTMFSRSYVSSMPEVLKGFRVAVLFGCLYLVGGEWNGIKRSSVQKFDPKTNAWTKLASMTKGRSFFGLAQLNEKLYVLGENTIECYDPRQNVWKGIGLIDPGFQYYGITVAKGQFYLIGRDYFGGVTLKCYHPESKGFSMICSLREPLSNQRLYTTFRDKVVVCYNDRIEEYKPETNEWKVCEDLKGLNNVCYVFSYSNKLLMSEFVESKF